MFIISFHDNTKIFLKVKEKSVMENKIFDFAKTKDALGELSADLIEFESALKIKQNTLLQDKKQNDETLKQKDLKISELTKVAEDILAKIENINKYIEEAL